MKALIHIGIPKSGTSSIQAFLACNRAALADQGVLYAPFNPEFGSQYELPVTALGACGAQVGPELERRRLGFRGPEDQRAYIRRYADWMDGLLRDTDLPRFIASSEHIHAWLTTPEQIAALDRFLTARFSEVQYLVYLRPQEELLTSSYSEAVRRGATHDFATHLAARARLDLWRGVKPWVEGVGRARLHVRLMVPDALEGGDLLADFCAAAGIEAAGLTRPARANTALSVGEIALRRRLNRVLPVHTQSGRAHPLQRVALRCLSPLVRDRARLRLSPAQLVQVRACNAASNEKLRKRFFWTRPALF